MRSIAVFFTLLAVALPQHTHAQETPDQEPAPAKARIHIGCRDVDGNKSARVPYEREPMSTVGVRHGLPFELLILHDEALADDAITGCWLALTDSGLHELEHRSLIHQCDYYVPIYGLAIVKLTSGEYLTRAFFLNPSWKNEEADSIPDEHPLPEFPETDDPDLRAILVDWWNTIVLDDVAERWADVFTLEPVE